MFHEVKMNVTLVHIWLPFFSDALSWQGLITRIVAKDPVLVKNPSKNNF